MSSEVVVQSIDEATVRFCGDSGDGMQLTGGQFTRTTGVAGNDLMTFPDFPAEIRAPQGTLAGVSGFQIHFSSKQIYTPGDAVDVLVAMNPAALKANLSDLKARGILIANTDSFDERSLTKVQYESNPLEDPDLESRYSVIKAPITTLTRNALEDLGMSKPDMDRCKNFFALGITYWLYNRDPVTTLNWIQDKFKKKEVLVEANQRALKAGINFAETSELFSERYEVHHARMEPGIYRNITGSSAIAMGLAAVADRSGLPIMYGSYPITPASDILHELSRYKNYGIKTFQAEDEIAAVCAAIGASYGGVIGATASSGPGINLKLEAINLAVMTELPLIVINAQRAGPSTGLPTKNEQSDLLQTFFGRNGESPLVILSAITPGDCFHMTMEAARLAIQFMTPVFVLVDSYITMGSEPWRIPEVSQLPRFEIKQSNNGVSPDSWQPYGRDDETLARLWAIPGSAGFEHRIGGLEKDSLTGNVSYDPDNHQHMVETRARKIAGIANFIPEQEVYGDSEGDLLVLGWGSTHGALRAAVAECRAEGIAVSHAQLRYLNPFPKNLGAILNRFKRILIPELNNGQLAFLIRANFLKETIQLNKIKGRPFLVSEIKSKILELNDR
ncbi:MAG: 2-oxoacid:acceptor oxidoreductase subunit alpha [Leptospiraceae bacterium]|nr:2-oxoacid:acceptor oxidoreductase subunit alpha [Leptospiraceae bacterium]